MTPQRQRLGKLRNQHPLDSFVVTAVTAQKVAVDEDMPMIIRLDHFQSRNWRSQPRIDSGLDCHENRVLQLADISNDYLTSPGNTLLSFSVTYAASGILL